MLTLNRWLALWFIFLSYLILGGLVFYVTERNYEEIRKREEKPETLGLEDILDTYYTWTNGRAHRRLYLILHQYCNVSIFKNAPSVNGSDQHDPIDDEEYQWTYFNSFFFALTTLSTIGYGNLHPTSCLGRMLVIAYSLVGIPLNGIVLTQLGDLFASTFLNVHQRYKGKRFETRFILIVDIIIYLIPGILIFIFLPTGIFVYFEGWTFEESIYFAFVTLTTIGYGDFVAGQTTYKNLQNVYKIFLTLWIMFGLGYLVMILGFISRAMRCKKVADFEQKLTRNIRSTHAKLWNGFAKDVTYVRRLLNEIHLLRYEPVYRDEYEDNKVLPRCHSAPNLTEWPIMRRRSAHGAESGSEDDEEIMLKFQEVKMKRRPGVSENLFKRSSMRMKSTGDLCHIDRAATFERFVACDGVDDRLIARFVDAIESTYTQPDSSDDEEELPKRKVSRFEKELQEIGVMGQEKNDRYTTDNNKRSWTMSYEEEPSAYSEQWTWPNAEGNAKITVARHRSDLHRRPSKYGLEGSKRPSLTLPGVNSLRRISVAAMNFLAGSGSHHCPPEVKMRGKTGKPRGRKKQSYSLCSDYDSMLDYADHLTQNRIKRDAILASLVQGSDGTRFRSSLRSRSSFRFGVTSGGVGFDSHVLKKKSVCSLNETHPKYFRSLSSGADGSETNGIARHFPRIRSLRRSAENVPTITVTPPSVEGNVSRHVRRFSIRPAVPHINFNERGPEEFQSVRIDYNK